MQQVNRSLKSTGRQIQTAIESYANREEFDFTSNSADPRDALPRYAAL